MSDPVAAGSSAAVPSPRPPAARRRRGGLVAIVVIGVVVGLLAVLAVVAESVARQQAAARIADEVRSEFSLPADQPLDVRIAGASVLLQLLGGRLDEVEVSADRIEVEPFEGDISLVLTGVPLDASQPVDSLSAVVTVTEEVVRAAGESLLDLPFRGLELEDGLIRVATALPVFGTELPLTVALAPSVDAGALVLTPTDVALAEGADVPLGDLLGLLGLDAEGGALAAPSFCVDERLPADISLRSAEVVGAEIELELGGEGVQLRRTGETSTGSCG
ncbi:LmeA family phospholipid-binding protein [Microcella daejeonensis]|uniref:LmeA family phospholipid-binding protein n=1 Tax=Microcella daejeonensis TaxID=2994971 RepID=UPI00226D7496|nr:LmeA family phospholipid-binding protein [Microcella daejeonensis]WAB83108.1 LmeA family phospholipid-binding protein [Microcella daejeonensis]